MGQVLGISDQSGRNPSRSPGVVFWGDSIPYGVHNETFAGPRQPMYLNGQSGGASTRFTFVGTQSFAGNGGGLSADPLCECYPGDTLVNLNTLFASATWFYPQVAILWGGTNDLNPAIGNFTPAQTASNMSTFMDSVQAKLAAAWPWYRMIVCNVLQRSDDLTINANIQTYNALVPGVIAGKSYKANVIACDVYASVSPANYFSDGVHLLDAGSTQLAVPLSAALNTALAVCR